MMSSMTEHYHERVEGLSQYGPLPYEDTCHVWEQLDADRRGTIKLDTLLKWLEKYAHWSVPPEEVGKVYRALAGRDFGHVITKALWFKNMSDYLCGEEEEETQQKQEPVQAPIQRGIPPYESMEYRSIMNKENQGYI